MVNIVSIHIVIMSRQDFIMSIHCLHIICQLSGQVPSSVSRTKTEQSVREDDRLNQNNNMYTWPHILSWCTIPDIFANEF